MESQTSQELIIFLRQLREEIIRAFSLLEGGGAAFERKAWSYANGRGGGEIALLRGKTFEKAAVNFSALSGETFPMNDGFGPFFATGISLITHMRNPHAPTVHMNIRYIKTQEKFWFGGGYDLTPMGFPYAEDTLAFHQNAKNSLDPFGEEIYPQFSKNAREYFFIPHRKKERGVGGIFFDHYNSGEWEKDVALWKGVGNSFLQGIMPIYAHRVLQPYGEQERAIQLQIRGHYAEFNLLYDRGTKFGFLSGGNPEAILCSMPPLASW